MGGRATIGKKPSLEPGRRDRTDHESSKTPSKRSSKGKTGALSTPITISLTGSEKRIPLKIKPEPTLSKEAKRFGKSKDFFPSQKLDLIKPLDLKIRPNNVRMVDLSYKLGRHGSSGAFASIFRTGRTWIIDPVVRLAVLMARFLFGKFMNPKR